MTIPYKRPHPFQKSSKIGIIAPSGAIRDKNSLGFIKTYFLQHQIETTFSPSIDQTWKYFSAPDRERAGEMMEMVKDPEIGLILALRGGYGLSRLLPYLDFDAISQSQKIFCGFSDFTIFNLACLAKAKLVSFYGPMAAPDFGKPEIDNEMKSGFWQVFNDKQFKGKVEMTHPYRNQSICGEFWGGCLSLITHLIGSPFLPQITGGLFFIEDVNEEPYKIERMLYQLYYSGILEKQNALLFGHFSGCKPGNGSAAQYTMEEVVEHFTNLLNIPVLTGFPTGHYSQKVTIPVGVPGFIDLNGTGYSFESEGLFA